MADGYLCVLKPPQMSGQDYLNPETMAESLLWMEKVQVQQPAWLFISLFLLLGVFAWIRIYYGNILMDTIQASTNFQVTSRMLISFICFTF
jgi:hypothetical protein